jgi:hypothetical protein
MFFAMSDDDLNFVFRCLELVLLVITVCVGCLSVAAIVRSRLLHWNLVAIILSVLIQFLIYARGVLYFFLRDFYTFLSGKRQQVL